MRAPVAALLDAAAIGVFAAVGRASHEESVGLAGIAETAWPFWAGTAVGWLVTRAWRDPASLRVGLGVWAGTLLGGMGLRFLSGGGIQLAFVIVAAITMAVFLLAWRGVALAVGNRRATAASQ